MRPQITLVLPERRETLSPALQFQVCAPNPGGTTWFSTFPGFPWWQFSGCSISNKAKTFGVSIWGVLPDDLFCEAPFSLLFTVLIPPVLAEDILEIYLWDPVAWGLNWYKYLVFNISELTLIDWLDFYPFLAFIRHLFRPHSIKSVSWACQRLWQIFLRFHGCNLSVLKWTTWLLLLLSGGNLIARLEFSFGSNLRLS